MFERTAGHYGLAKSMCRTEQQSLPCARWDSAGTLLYPVPTSTLSNCSFPGSCLQSYSRPMCSTQHLSTPPTLCHWTVVSARVPECWPAMLWLMLTGLFSGHPLHACSILSASTPELLLCHGLAPPSCPMCSSNAGAHVTLHSTAWLAHLPCAIQQPVHMCTSSSSTPAVFHSCSSWSHHQDFGSSTPTLC